MAEIDILNQFLLDYGGRTEKNEALYRLVWSDTIFEHRYGTFCDFTESGLFIREVTEVRLVRKYNYINERFILEKWAPGSLAYNREIPGSENGDYVPVYIFEDNRRKYIEPNRRVLKFLIDVIRGQVRKEDEISQELLDEKEVEKMTESFDDAAPFSTRGAARNAIGYEKTLKDK